MKKVIFVLAFVFAFGAAHVTHASAAVVCDNPDHPIWSLDNSTKEGCIADVVWKASIASQINQNDKNDFVKVVRGQHLMTTFGPDFCQDWFPMDCVIKKSFFVKFI